MNLAKIGIKYPITTTMFFTALVLIGIFSYYQLGLDLMPELELPTIVVTTYYSGAASEEIESEVTEVLEEYLSTVPDLDEIESISSEAVSTVILKFKWGINLDSAANDTREKIDLAKKELPEDAEDPIIFKFNLAMIPIYILGVTAEQSFDNLYDIADDYICDKLETIPGLASAMIRGGNKKQVNIKLHLDKINAYGIPLALIEQAITNSNLSLPIGHLRTGQIDYLLRMPEKIELNEIGNITVKKSEDRRVYLKDVADIEFGFEEETRQVRVNGRKGMVIMVQKRSGENTVDVVRRLRKKLIEIEKILPPDVKLFTIRDFSEFIELTIANLRVSLFWGGFLVSLVVLFFIGNISSSLFILTALPTCLLIAFFLLFLGNYTLNIISLSSLAIALGMVVDSAIVVLDSISRKKEQGLSLIPAALEGSSEVAKPVIASVLTTIVVFFPVLFMGGITGILFKQMAFVISLTLLVSLLNALWLIPMLSSRTNATLTPDVIRDKFINYGQKFLTYLENLYVDSLTKALARPKFFLVMMFLFFIFTVMLSPFVGVKFFSEADSSFFSITAELPSGTRVEETGKVADALGKIIEKEVLERTAYFQRWGYGEEAERLIGWEEGSNISTVAVKLEKRKKRERSVFEIVDELRKKTENILGAKIRFDTQDPLASLMFGVAKPLELEIYGRDLDLVTEFVNKLYTELENISGIYDLEVSRKVGRPEIEIEINREKAEKLGLRVTEVASNLRTLFQGKDISQFAYRGKDYDINLRLREEDRTRIDDISRVYIVIPNAAKVKLTDLAKIRYEVGPSKIERKNQERVVKLTANLRGIGIDKAISLINKKIQGLGIPPQLHYSFGGEFEEKREAFSLMKQATVLAIILVYMVMASQFESFIHPFFILFSIPFAFVGVILLLLLTHTYFTLDSFLGLIMLIGIVVNNAIVLISYMNLLKAKAGLDVLDLVIQAGKRRLRPILMTSITTIFGLLPLSLQRGEGAEYWRPFSNTIIGGLSISFVITLFIIPVIYYLYERKRIKK